MRIFSLKQEDYPAIADFIAVSFERDLVEFTGTYKTMNAEYLERFKNAITALKNHDSAAGLFVKQKETTARMYKISEEMKHKIVLLKDYCTRSGVDTSMIANMVQKINGKNIEGIIKSMRDALPYFMDNANKIADMPDGFLEKIVEQTKELDVLNVEQNRLMNERKLSTSEGKKLYEIVQKYIGEVAKAGKLIFKNDNRKDEYVISKIIARMKTIKQQKQEMEMKKEETPQN
ncbi:MAG: hypothetical protein Q3983_08685 [Capnocytophaga sp.]|nr:hypothetical protein [Capnocytophaga sp.]